MEFSGESQRRSGVRVLRPWLKSARMVGLFYRIGMLASSRPGKLATIELLVDRLSRPAAAALRPSNTERPTVRMVRFKE
jgi:hypothetical protein